MSRTAPRSRFCHGTALVIPGRQTGRPNSQRPHRRQNGRVEIDGNRACGTVLCRAAAPVRPPAGPILLRMGTGRAQCFAPDTKSFSPVKYRALACDYDGTLAHDGVVTPSTAAAVDRFRASGRHLFMVTGREWPELEQVCPLLDR